MTRSAMTSRTWSKGCAVAAMLLTLAALTPTSQATGFHIFEQGTRALGMANAFTAQADDPSAMYFNPGGLAFQKDRAFMGGVSVILLGNSDFEGLNPFPGVGATGEQKKQFVTPIHFYYLEPINEKFNFGLSLTTPFGLTTEWENPETFPGRFISERASLTSIDLTPTFSYQPNEKFGVGFGVIIRSATLELDRTVGLQNPFDGGALADVARTELESDVDHGLGFNFGVLHKPNDFFSWGFTYRSEVEIDFEGDGRFTQVFTGDTPFDDQVAAAIPFGGAVPLETTIEFPATASLGLAFKATDTMTFETDINWAGWSSFDRTNLVFPGNSSLNSEVVSLWEDSYNYRAGFLFDRGEGKYWSAGIYFDQSPQPDATFGPLLPDADRAGISGGWGRDGKRFDLDIALLYLQFESRTTTTNQEGFNGTYETDTWVASTSLSW